MNVEELMSMNSKKDLGITVPDDWRPASYSVDQFAIPPHYSKYLDRVLLPRGLVLDRTEKLGMLSKYLFLIYFNNYKNKSILSSGFVQRFGQGHSNRCSVRFEGRFPVL